METSGSHFHQGLLNLIIDLEKHFSFLCHCSLLVLFHFLHILESMGNYFTRAPKDCHIVEKNLKKEVRDKEE